MAENLHCAWIMAVVFIITFFIITLTSTKLISFAADWAQMLHFGCIELTKSHTHATEIAAIVCGRQPEPTTLVEDLRQLGLYHLLVVSGAHLGFLMSVWRVDRRKVSPFVLLLLFAYVLVCNLNTPVIRAYFHLAVASIAAERQWSWTRVDAVLVSGLLCMLAVPHQAGSLSLYLSWFTTLTLVAVREGFFRQTLIYLGVQAALNHLTVMHPLTIWTNIILAPLMGYVLLPVSALALLLPPLSELCEAVWKFTGDICGLITANLYLPAATAPSFWAWIALAAAHIYYLFAPNFRGKKTSVAHA